MSAQSRKPRARWLVLAIVLMLVAGVAPYIRHVCLVADIQNSIARNVEITLNDPGNDSVPEFIDDVMYKTAEWYGGLTHASHNQRELYYDRLTAPFRGLQLRNLEIYDPKNFDERLCKVVGKCKALRSLSIVDWGGWATPPTPSESSWRSLCETLRMLPRLETLHLASEQLTDDALAPLAGHPTLRRFSLERVGMSITPAAAHTFASMPNLKELALGQPSGGTEDVWTEAAIAEFQMALPGVAVTFQR